MNEILFIVGDLPIHFAASGVGAAVGLCRDCALTINGKVAKPRVLQ